MVVTFPIAVIVVARILMPRQGLPLSKFPGAHALACADDSADAVPAAAGDVETTAGFAAWIERSPLAIVVLVAALLSWLYHHFVTRGSSLDLNAFPTDTWESRWRPFLSGKGEHRARRHRSVGAQQALHAIRGGRQRRPAVDSRDCRPHDGSRSATAANINPQRLRGQDTPAEGRLMFGRVLTRIDGCFPLLG